MPEPGIVKINTDGASKQNGLFSSCGGVIRGELGNWIADFSANLGVGSNSKAEHFGILYGLELAWKMGFRKVQLESDSSAMLELISKGSTTYHPHFPIIQECRNLISKYWSIQLGHVYREGNYVADWLANLRVSLQIGYHLWDKPPDGLSLLLLHDILGIAQCRIVAF
ncbi:Ribonuclease H [Quillaja saponaria]|uniref:Ribonuclease H n=1 Tax=Quillaja saponaria TaxID=32244 RepID=A0AAD7PYK3_QUISA|nr:Ribonuclease H [Quillaja saponaria]